MTMGSREDREKLKEEYKAHYRAIREIKQKAAEARRTVSIQNALQAIQSSEVVQQFDNALHAVHEQIAKAEAKLEVYLHGSDEGHLSEEDHDVVRKQQARESVDKIRREMGIIQDELNQKLAELPEVKKSVGRPTKTVTSAESEPQSSAKTIGPRKPST